MISEIQSLNNDLLGAIYGGVIKGKSFIQIHKDLVLITQKENKYGKVDYKLSFNTAVKIAKQITHKVKKEKVESTMLALFVYTFLKQNDTYHQMLSCTYQTAQQFEAKEKKKIINQSLDKAKDKTQYELDKLIFFVSSKHLDCAKDHLPYQGKVYIDKRWKSLIKSQNIRDEIEKYINKNGILTFQDITFRPVWLFTRPNCRHYYAQISVDEALSNSIGQLLNKYDLKLTLGSQTTKTIPHNLDKSWYTESNISNIIEKYKQRLDYHEKLFSIHRIEEIRHAIEKDKMLIKKWQNYLQNKI